MAYAVYVKKSFVDEDIKVVVQVIPSGEVYLMFSVVPLEPKQPIPNHLNVFGLYFIYVIDAVEGKLPMT